MASRPEQFVSRTLRTILADLADGASIMDSEHLRDLFGGLERYVPEVLARTYPAWQHESLDGFCPLSLRKTGDGEAEMFGHCIVISDQTLTPIHLRIQVSPTTDEVVWFDCRLGEATSSVMVRIPWPSGNATDKLVRALQGREDTIDWVYEANTGRKQL